MRLVLSASALYLLSAIVLLMWSPFLRALGKVVPTMFWLLNRDAHDFRLFSLQFLARPAQESISAIPTTTIRSTLSPCLYLFWFPLQLRSFFIPRISISHSFIHLFCILTALIAVVYSAYTCLLISTYILIPPRCRPKPPLLITTRTQSFKMQIPISLAFYLLATSASAFPIGFGLEIRKLSNPNCSAASATAAATAAAASPTVVSQANSAAVGSSASVLSPSTYNAIQISTGTAGNSKANADALFSAIDQSNLAGVSAEDLKIIQDTHDAAENAETEAFNPAIAAASGDAATALQVRYSIHGLKKTLLIEAERKNR